MDDIDRISVGSVVRCPKCNKPFEDMNPDVSRGLLNNHLARNKCEES